MKTLLKNILRKGIFFVALFTSVYFKCAIAQTEITPEHPTTPVNAAPLENKTIIQNPNTTNPNQTTPASTYPNPNVTPVAPNTTVPGVNAPAVAPPVSVPQRKDTLPQQIKPAIDQPGHYQPNPLSPSLTIPDKDNNTEPVLTAPGDTIPH